MELTFYLAAAVATASTFMVIISTNAVHALLYLIVSFLALAVDMYLIGAPFAAALEVIVYAGAIVVLFVFVVMMLNVGDAEAQERQWFSWRAWIGAGSLAGLLLIALLPLLFAGGFAEAGPAGIEAKAVGTRLFGPYLIAVELASLLLLAGMVGAYHLARREDEEQRY